MKVLYPLIKRKINYIENHQLSEILVGSIVEKNEEKYVRCSDGEWRKIKSEFSNSYCLEFICKTRPELISSIVEETQNPKDYWTKQPKVRNW